MPTIRTEPSKTENFWALSSAENLYTAHRKSKRRWLCIYFNFDTRELRSKLIKARNPGIWFHEIQGKMQERGVRYFGEPRDRSI